MPAQPNNFNPMMGEMPIPFSNFQEAPKTQEHYPNLYGKLNLQVYSSFFEIRTLSRMLGSFKI